MSPKNHSPLMNQSSPPSVNNENAVKGATKETWPAISVLKLMKQAGEFIQQQVARDPSVEKHSSAWDTKVQRRRWIGSENRCVNKLIARTGTLLAKRISNIRNRRASQHDRELFQQLISEEIKEDPYGCKLLRKVRFNSYFRWFTRTIRMAIILPSLRK